MSDDTKATTNTDTHETPEAVTGVQLMRGIGHRPSRGFWADAWSQVVQSPRALIAMVWVGIVAFFACYSPFIANGHPYSITILTGDDAGATSRPLVDHLTAADVLLAIGGIFGVLWLALPLKIARSLRLALLAGAGLQCLITTILCQIVKARSVANGAPDWLRSLEQSPGLAVAIVGVIAAVLIALVPIASIKWRVSSAFVVALVAIWANVFGWTQPPTVFDYRDREAAGEISAVYAPIPFSPNQRDTQLDLINPGFTVAQGKADIKNATDLANNPEDPANAADSPTFLIGSDSLGQDVLSQLLHACRLSISIGLVSTGVAVMIGVTLGALMGYYGGKVDMLLFRVVEIFMAVPVLFLLIVAAGVLPKELRTTYVVMVIIGCFTWTGPARFIRSEFFKLRKMDFVQSAEATGLSLRSILFKHMLPNGVTPVLVEASFAIAVAILFEAILSFLGLGPPDQASWGRLLSEATNQVGDFVPHLALAPGFAIFLTVLSFTLISEALRDAIDPKLKKARV